MLDTPWIAPVHRNGPQGGEDWFALTADGYEAFLEEHHLEIRYVDPVSGAILAARKTSPVE